MAGLTRVRKYTNGTLPSRRTRYAEFTSGFRRRYDDATSTMSCYFTRNNLELIERTVVRDGWPLVLFRVRISRFGSSPGSRRDFGSTSGTRTRTRIFFRVRVRVQLTRKLTKEFGSYAPYKPENNFLLLPVTIIDRLSYRTVTVNNSLVSVY